jgi:adenylate kinase
MTRNPLVIVVGMTGVGKTSITDRAVEQVDRPVEYLSYGTLLLEEGRRQDLVYDRDEITELDPDQYDALQSYTADRIASILNDGEEDSETVYILDTHATLQTPYGYRPGFSDDDIETIQPDQFAFIKATPAEIQDRRLNDASRDRDMESAAALTEQQDMALHMTTAFAAAGRTPVAVIENSDGKLDVAVDAFIPLLTRDQ